MRTRRFSAWRFSVVTFMVSFLATNPPNLVQAETPGRVQVKTIVTRIELPPDGNVILPPEIPAELREQAMALIKDSQPGQAVVMAPAGVLTPELQKQVEKEIAKVGGMGITKIVDTAAGPSGAVVATGGTKGPQPYLLMPLGCFIVLVIIVIIVVVVIIYVLAKICSKIPPPQTNAPPPDPYPAVVHRNGGVTPLDLQPGKEMWLTNGLPATNGYWLQYSTNLQTWMPLVAIDVSGVCEVTNSTGSTDWALVTLADTNGQVIASTLASGTTNEPPTLMQQKGALNVPFPGPTPDKLFLRLEPK